MVSRSEDRSFGYMHVAQTPLCVNVILPLPLSVNYLSRFIQLTLGREVDRDRIRQGERACCRRSKWPVLSVSLHNDDDTLWDPALISTSSLPLSSITDSPYHYHAVTDQNTYLNFGNFFNGMSEIKCNSVERVQEENIVIHSIITHVRCINSKVN